MGNARLTAKTKAHKKSFLAFGTRAFGLERFDRVKSLAHGRKQLLNIRPHKYFDNKAAALFKVQAGHGQRLDGKVEGAGLIGKARAGCAWSHVADDKVKGAHFCEPGFKLCRAVKHVFLHKGHLGRKNRLGALDVAGQHKPARSNLFCGAQRPRARGSAKIKHPLAGAQQAELGVQLLELVDRARGIVLALGFQKIMITVFFHGEFQQVTLSFFIAFAKCAVWPLARCGKVCANLLTCRGYQDKFSISFQNRICTHCHL